MNTFKHPLVIAGPCSAESLEQVIGIAEALSSAGVQIFRAGVWKPRTRPGGFEGIGKEALEWLKEVKKKTLMAVTTEVANSVHVEEALSAGIDILWLGARTTVNPFAVQEIADSLRGVDVPVFIKNPINPDIELWCGAVQRLRNAGVSDLGLIHRGFSSYQEKLYRNSPIWQIPIEMKRRFPQLPMICDPSHIAGSRELVPQLCQQAMDLSFDGLMIETHIHPDSALSDGQQQLEPKTLIRLLQSLEFRENDDLAERLTVFRDRIDKIDRSLMELLSERMKISREIGVYKKAHRIPVLQNRRYDTILQESVTQARELDLPPDFVATLMKAIHEESVKQQMS
ncbi:MAG: bifunctional 3-deoxy-7-phosphoheptulonate synthase/chorismate mutase type II [Alistipes sp.]|nr:bifunctional 3-deoxy-7-phosphoheptulonate synthase/chorismate mutase type II [Candidatus Minthomonas equi]